MALPNFLVAGAAKCGTTSLYHYLNKHPEIFMAPVKEPKFITSQFLNFPLNGAGDDVTESYMVKDYNSYLNLFSSSQKEKAVGEASADTLFYYRNSIKVIRSVIGEPRIIIMLRNPIERAVSNYYYLLKDGRETLSFENAIEEEENRMRHNWSFLWAYKEQGLYYNQVRAFVDNFKNVRIYLYEDFEKDTLGLVRDIYRFLGVDDTFSPNITEIHNKSGIPRNKTLHYLLTKPNTIKSVGKSIFKRIKLEEKLKSYSLRLKNKNLYKEDIKEESKQKLIKYYKEDVLALENLLNLNLSSWLI